ncbi:protein kinase domain-containing protein [Mucilaginibacter flavus]|uniref:protein kinase domain-containing protein n=1 Tax=Mucilaginibacter flavus TaxID=931504 RepID=UPI0025B3DECA|nr:protein kinase [Mucilaginibacter flavus]MDN3582350.1 protein kinase [Mucilaginibacter flavus]
MQTLIQLKRGELKGAVSLTLSEGLEHFPEEIFELSDTLERLDLSSNKLTALPIDFGRLKNLKVFFCSENLFTALPEVLADCPLLDTVGFKSNRIETVPGRAINLNLRWLILTNNKISVLPPEIGRCSRMQKLMLAGNQLTELPDELKNCQGLSLLRVSANRLTALPGWLLTMPKLAWLAISGNRFNIKPDVLPPAFIDWANLEIKQLLGEGASGMIYKAATNAGGKEVAVKVFKGAVTSDGFPEDEMNAYIAAGHHPGLAKLIGQIKGNPEGKTGLVMELIPPRFFNLGMPPSLASCTRDVFKEGFNLSLNQVLKIATTIASLAAQLHRHGIMHGDLYAHNTLIDEAGNTLFSDFGAASFYDITDEQPARAFERIEVSAYGYLLDDLLFLCNEKGNESILKKITELKNECLAPAISSRPGFEYLTAELGRLLELN